MNFKKVIKRINNYDKFLKNPENNFFIKRYQNHKKNLDLKKFTKWPPGKENGPKFFHNSG